MMNRNIEHYVRLYDNVFDREFCCETITALQTQEWEKHCFSSYKPSQSNPDIISHEDDLFVSSPNSMLQTHIITQKLWHVLDRYIRDLDMSWQAGWTGYSVVRFNRYDINTYMRLHADHIKTLFDGDRKGDPTLSIVGALNDDYEGGDFVFWQDRPLKIPTGSVLVFPSNFLYPHEVTPITKGTRYTYVSWSW